MPSYPCPCCGYLMFSDPPGTYEICEICGWEDDPVQLRWPTMGGANEPLFAAQRRYAELGAKNTRAVKWVRSPRAGDVRDPDWRPLSPEDMNTPAPGSYWAAVIEDAEHAAHQPYYWRARSVR